MIHPVLVSAFRDLEQNGIRWAVLRLPDDPGKRGGDVDLLVDTSDTSRLRDAMNRHGFVELRGWQGGLHFLRYDYLTDRWVWLHFVTELTFGPKGCLRTDAAAESLARRGREGDIVRLDPGDEFWVLLLHCLLDKGTVAPRHQRRLEQLVDAARADSLLADALATICPPGLSPAVLLGYARAGDWVALNAVTCQLIEAARPRGVRDVSARLLSAPSRLLERFATHNRRRGLGVALLGPDGAGKSTLAAGLEDSFIFPVRQVYMGLTGGLLPWTNRLRLPPLVIAGRMLVLWSRYLKARYHQACGRMVVFDRYIYDAMVPTPYALGRLGRLYRWIDGRACPPPDLVLVLNAPGEIMHARKGEYNPQMLEDWRQHFLTLQGKVRNLQVVDACKPQDDVRRDALERIWQRYASRQRA